MKKFNRFITFALVCVLMLCAVPFSTRADAASDQVFADVAPGAWYYEAVNSMAKGGLLAGYSDGLFHPNDKITYGQFAMILCKITGTPTESDGFLDGKEGSNHWAAYAIFNILQTKIFVRNYKTADEILWRAEAFEAMVDLAQQMPKYNYNGITDSFGTQVSDKVWTWDNIPDADAVKKSTPSANGGIHSWTWPKILQAYNLGITTGTNATGTCNPKGLMTRAEVCQMLYNMGISTANSVTIRNGGGIM